MFLWNGPPTVIWNRTKLCSEVLYSNVCEGITPTTTFMQIIWENTQKSHDAGLDTCGVIIFGVYHLDCYFPLTLYCFQIITVYVTIVSGYQVTHDLFEDCQC